MQGDVNQDGACHDTTRENSYKTLTKLVIGYNKNLVLSSVTDHSLEIVDRNMEDIERSLSTVVAAFEEMRATSKSTSDNSERIDSMMKEILAKNTAMDSGIVQRVEEIGEASRGVDRLQSQFDQLKEKGMSIGSMAGAIRDVSDRTNILAINASIEAARAGAIGKGFRIIANEVRTLANQTGDFAQKIDDTIDAFQTSMEAVTGEIEGFRNLFRKFKDSFGDVLANFKENAENVGVAGDSLNQIARALKEETEALQDGLSSLERIQDNLKDTHAVFGSLRSVHTNLGVILDRES